MYILRSYRTLAAVLLFALLFSGCAAVQQFFPTPTPPATPTPQAYTGKVGERTAYNGWAMTVSNVLRSSLNPAQIVPQPGYIDDEYDYISMDVTVERTIDDRGSVYGDDFTLVDAAGNEIRNAPIIDDWLYGGDQYFGTPVTDRLTFHLPRAEKDVVLRMSPWPEVPEPLEVRLDMVSMPRRISLQEAMERGLLTADVRGMSLESIEVEVSLKVEESLELSIQPGTTFLAPSPDLQTMMVRQELWIFLDEKDEVSLEVDVACANMRLKAPEGGEEYIVKIEPPAEELRKLLGLPEFQDASFRLQQFTIWTYTDKPARSQYVGLGTGGEGSGPSSKELETIAGWFEAAGLNIQDYPGLRK